MSDGTGYTEFGAGLALLGGLLLASSIDQFAGGEILEVFILPASLLLLAGAVLLKSAKRGEMLRHLSIRLLMVIIVLAGLMIAAVLELY